MAKKRILTLVMSVALLLAVTIGGTLAYLTDTDEEVNVMTLGNVQIDLIEQQRGENGLEDFVDGKELTPLVGSAQGAKDGYGMPVASNYVDKIVTVENTGKSPAYVRVWVAVPAALEQADNANGPLHWNLGNRFNADGQYVDGYTNPGYADIAISDAIAIEIDGIAYNAYTFTYKTALAAGGVTKCPAITGFYLDSAVDNYVNADGELVYTFNGKDVEFDLTKDVEIPVFAQAVQAAGFGDANAAFDAAFGAPAVDNHPWMPKKVSVDEADELVDALAGRNEITLEEEELKVDDHLTASGNSVLDLNGNTLTVNGSFENADTLIIKNGDLNAGTKNDYGVIALPNAETIIEDVDVVSLGGGVAVTDGAKLTFNSGSVAVESANTSGRYNFYVIGEGTEVTINGGTFSFSKTLNQKRAYIYVGSGATVYVNGGTFGPASARDGYTAGILGNGTVIITGGTFGFDPSAWVADGYQAVMDGTTWTVSAK